MKADDWERFDYFGWGMAAGVALMITAATAILALTT